MSATYTALSVAWCAMDRVPALDEPLKKIARRRHREGDGRAPRPAHGRRPAAPLPAAVRGARASSPASPTCRWTSTSPSSPRSPTPAGAHVQPAAGASGSKSTITDGSGRLQLVFFGRGVHKPHKELLPGTPRDVRGQGVRLQPPAPARPPRLRAAGAATARRRPSTPSPDQLIPIYPAVRAAGVLEDRQGRQTRVLPQRPGGRRPAAGSLRDGRGLVPLPDALRKIHRPRTKADIADARDRLKWDEAFVLQVALARRRHADAQLPAVAAQPAAGRPARRLRRQAALHPHRGPAEGQQGDLRRPGHRAPDAPAAPGRSRVRARRSPLTRSCSTPGGFRAMGDDAGGGRSRRRRTERSH